MTISTFGPQARILAKSLLLHEWIDKYLIYSPARLEGQKRHHKGEISRDTDPCLFTCTATPPVYGESCYGR